MRGLSGWILLLLASALYADAPPSVIATAAGYIPGATPIALQQHLVQPLVVAYDPTGTLYYGTAHQVWRFNSDGTATLIAGTGTGGTTPLGDGGPATSASLGTVSGLAIDSQQNVYISDLMAYEVRMVTPAGIISRFAGTGAAPLYGYGSNAGAGTHALQVATEPGSLAIDSAYLYVSDSVTSSVLAFTLDGKTSKVIAGNHGSQTAGDGGSAVNSSLFYPGAIALAGGVLYINEAGGARIRQVTFRTGVISTLVQLAQTYLTDNGNEGLAADSDGTVYLQHSNTIFRIDPGANSPRLWAGGGDSNPGDPGPALKATLLSPVALAVNPSTHDVALADFSGNIVQVISDSDGTIETNAGFEHFAGDSGPAALAIFNGLEGVVSDSQGNVYLADVGNNRIRRIDTTGIVTTVAGTGIIGFSGDFGPATSAELNLRHTPPFANNLAIDTAGNLYISDYGNRRIRKIDTSGQITTIAGGGTAPLSRGEPALLAAIQPGPLAVDASGNVYFGNVLTTGAAAIPTIYKIDGSGQLSAFAGIASTGNTTDVGSAILTQVGYAYCLVADNSGNFYLCDSGFNRVRKIAPNGSMVTIAGNGGTASTAIQSGPPLATAIGSPTSVAIDQQNNVYIYSVRQVTEIDNTGTLQPFAGKSVTPQASTGDGGPATQASFTSITGMSFDPFGNLYLADAGDYLREIMPVGSNGPPPIVSSNGVVGAGDSIPPVQSVSPGGIVSIYGSNFLVGGAQPQLAVATLSGTIPIMVGGICASFGGIKAPILGVFPNQLNVVVPTLPPGPVTVQVTANCGGSKPVTGNVGAVSVAAESPEFFSTPDPVSGRSIIASDNVAGGAITAGATVEVYGTGWGATNPAIAPGKIPGGAAQLVAAPTLTLGGVAIPSLLYAGVSPCCAGLYQADFTIPSGTPKGYVPLVITVDGISSPSNAYINVQ